jgi:hypothetical protein
MMGLDVKGYNQQFLEKVKQKEPVYNDAAAKYKVDIILLPEIEVPDDATQYWRVIGVHHLTGPENMGNHHIYCDILDEEGNRINRARLILYQVDTDPVFATVDKPANEAGTNFPLWKADKARVAVFWPDDNPLPSEQAMGLSTGHPDEEMGNTLFHHSFYVVFQRTNIPENGEDGEGHGGGDSQLSLEETIALVGQSLIIPLNPDAMFFKFAKEKDLGERLSREFDVEHDGKMYRAQIYERGIVYAPIGEWHRTDVIPRTN